VDVRILCCTITGCYSSKDRLIERSITQQFILSLLLLHKWHYCTLVHSRCKQQKIRMYTNPTLIVSIQSDCSVHLKCKAVSAHAMKAYSGSRGTAPFISNLSVRQKWVVKFTSRPHYSPVNNHGTHWSGGSVGPKRRSGLSGEVSWSHRASLPSTLLNFKYILRAKCRVSECQSRWYIQQSLCWNFSVLAKYEPQRSQACEFCRQFTSRRIKGKSRPIISHEGPEWE
jgi:hypothetical protein